MRSTATPVDVYNDPDLRGQLGSGVPNINAIMLRATSMQSSAPVGAPELPTLEPSSGWGKIESAGGSDAD